MDQFWHIIRLSHMGGIMLKIPKSLSRCTKGNVATHFILVRYQLLENMIYEVGGVNLKMLLSYQNK